MLRALVFTSIRWPGYGRVFPATFPLDKAGDENTDRNASGNWEKHEKS